MATVQVGGLEIVYDRVGQGPPLVLVHGAAVYARMWQPQLSGLADEFTVVAWDEPGSGRSSGIPPGFGLADYADCLAALIEELRLGPAHVAGLSWGGTVVLELYRRHPSLVRTLLLADTYAGWKGSLPPEEVTARHMGAEYVVGFLGFAPGFAYLLGGDERLRVERRAEPRERVPAGEPGGVRELDHRREPLGVAGHRADLEVPANEQRLRPRGGIGVDGGSEVFPGQRCGIHGCSP